MFLQHILQCFQKKIQCIKIWDLVNKKKKYIYLLKCILKLYIIILSTQEIIISITYLNQLFIFYFFNELN